MEQKGKKAAAKRTVKEPDKRSSEDKKAVTENEKAETSDTESKGIDSEIINAGQTFFC